MKKECSRHLTSVIITSILKHGISYMEHLGDMAENWSGPLEDNDVFLGRDLIVRFGKKRAERIMGELKDFDIHPLFDRDFFKGLMDGMGISSDSRRICFYDKPYLREFLSSSEHPFKIDFEATKVKKRNRTLSLPFLFLPERGRIGQYFAGVISSSVPEYIGDEVFCKVSDKCSDTINRLGIIHKKEGHHLIFSPFYVMIFCGDLPSPIHTRWINILSEKRFLEMNTASMVALYNWRFVFGKKFFNAKDLPYLRSRFYYYDTLGLTMKDIDNFMKENNVGFVEKRVRDRIERWYNIVSQ